MEFEEPLDPKHSRPIDVHRWSDHPEVRALVDGIWREHFPDYAKKELVTSGAKPKTRHRDQPRDTSTNPTSLRRSINAGMTLERCNALYREFVSQEFRDRW